MLSLGLVFVALTAVGSASCGALAVDAWRRPSRPARLPFAGLMATSGVWSGLYAVGLLLPPDGYRWVVDLLGHATVAFVPGFFAWFAVAYAGRDDWLTRRRLGALFAVPTVLALGALTNPLHHRYVVEQGFLSVAGVTTNRPTFGPLFYGFVAFTYASAGGGTLLVLATLRRYEGLFGRQVLMLLLVSTLPPLASVAWVTNSSPVAGLQLTPMLGPLVGFAYGSLVFRYRLFGLRSTTPEFGRTVAVDEFDDGVVVVDRDGTVVDCNPAAAGALEVDADALVGSALAAHLPAATASTGVLDPETTTELTPGVGGRRYEAQSSAVRDQHDRVIGHTLVLRDVTDRHHREQRLAVLNRVLRHNLRNDLNVLHAYAGQLDEDAGADAPRDVSERMRRVTRRLVDLGEKARRVEDLLATDETSVTPVDAAGVVADVVDGVRAAAPNATVDVDCADDVTVATEAAVLDLVVTNLVENAVEHHDGPEPHVTVTVERTDTDCLQVAVADDGPGIPDHELQAIERGDETALEHGSGLGLWMIAWGVERLGGRYEVQDREPTGTQFVVTVPDRSPDRDVDCEPAVGEGVAGEGSDAGLAGGGSSAGVEAEESGAGVSEDAGSSDEEGVADD
jgi:signal transduction histidine kinase